ncbi:MAG: YraN family protein [Myxococcales bacterium]|nr:YraN family protein [Myxococcales bacterium]
MHKKQIGRWGETVACIYFWVRGYRIVARNVKIGRGELDIVLRRGKELRIVEVRTVTTAFLADATLAVNVRKQKQVLKLAKHYFSRYGKPDDQFYCDIVGIRLYFGLVPQIRWLPSEIR